MPDMIPQGRMDLGDGTGYEKGDANLRSVLITIVILLSSSVVVCLAIYAITNSVEKSQRESDAQIPAMYAQQAIPPKPRLLPSPFDDTQKPPALRGLNPQVAPREAYDTTSDDQLPWDKMRQESRLEDEQVNSYSYDKKSGAVSIPIEDAIAQAAGGSVNDFHSEPAGSSLSNLPPTYGGIYTRSSQWESRENKLTAESSGGTETETKSQ